LRQVYQDAVAGAKDGAVFVEVGAFFGSSAAHMAVEIINSGKRIEFHVVDSWEGNQELREQFATKSSVHQEFLDNIAPVAKQVRVHKMRSTSAARLFADNTVDFCFIDAAHERESVLEDIRAWLPKVKAGGTLAGHDYHSSFPGVMEAVNAVFGNRRITVTGRCWSHVAR